MMDDQTLGLDDLFVFPRDPWGFSCLGGLLEREAQANSQLGQPEWGKLGDFNQPPIILAQARVGDFLEVVRFRSSLHTMRYLSQMGITPGVVLEVSKRSFHGSVVVKIDDACLGLNARIARQVIVSYLGTSSQELEPYH
ncbi:FeoA family protein [Vacuolonema iberomarrocanum]|uniref:FeoA family protein n=1 Tax=Vacuolonema iberomarrocanum TaxID=3454632 RepID=UPI0019D8805E|nr:ferrous iron transport protein A [filamentous cyanobacterium LEGE 07170]